MVDPVAIECTGIAATELWLLDLSVPPCATERQWLSTSEMERASQFHNLKDQWRYLAAHCGLRLLLQNFSGIAADRMEFAIGPFGKPSLLGLSEVHFNMSYAEDRGLVGLSSIAEIGVDIEMLRPIDDVEELAVEYFTEAERMTMFMNESDAAKQAAFLQGWTRKEACIKAVGIGLSLPPASFTSGVTNERVIARLPTPNGLIFTEVRSVPLGSDMVGALSLVCQ